MSGSEDDERSSSGDRPGKLRTWWHPLLSRLLSHYLSTGFVVQDEVTVGQLPRRLDQLLIRQEDGYLTEACERALGVLIRVCKCYTLLEFKGPTDDLEAGDVGRLFGNAFLWHSQNGGTIAGREISLLILAPCETEGYRKELLQLGLESSEREPGLHQLTGGQFAAWLIETDVMAAQRHPILTLFSREFLRNSERILKELRNMGYAPLLAYMLQQIQQFQALGRDFAMQHTETQYLGKQEEEILQAVLEATPVEKRLQGVSVEDLLGRLTTEELLGCLTTEERLDGLTTEERLDGISTEDRLQGLTTADRLRDLSAEEMLAGLSEEQTEQLRQLLERRPRG